MTIQQQIIITLMCMLGTAITRFLPFLVFSSRKPAPKFIHYLGRVLPSAIFGILVVYCLKDISFLDGSHGLPELIAIAATILLHIWRRQTLLSIGFGTLVYMVLVQFIFV